MHSTWARSHQRGQRPSPCLSTAAKAEKSLGLDSGFAIRVCRGAMLPNQTRLSYLESGVCAARPKLAQCGVPIDLQQVLKSRVVSFSRAGLWDVQYSEPAQFQSRAPTSIAMGYMKEEVEIRCRVCDRLRRSLGISISMCHGNSLFARPRLPYFRCIAW